MKTNIISTVLLTILLCFWLVSSSHQASLGSDKTSKLMRGVNGGSDCMACTVVLSLTEQLAFVYNQSVEQALDKLCNFLPQGIFHTACLEGVKLYGPVIISGLYSKESPDVVCHLLHFCTNDPGQPECSLFPKPKNRLIEKVNSLSRQLDKKNIRFRHLPTKSSICTVAVFKEICDFFNKALNNHMPSEDIDGDGHSVYPALRGSSWKGKDCNDFSSSVHPGAKPKNGDKSDDSNCNGIYGMPSNSSVSYEDMFCKNSSQQGVVILGDSIGAHFHLPEEWFDATTIGAQAFENLAFIIENELDWPQLSGITGYMNTTWSVVKGTTRSIYLKLWERNRCNFRDYQNVAVNGANTNKMLSIVKTLNRNQLSDQPQLVFLSLVGNDVCNGDTDTLDHMTKPKVFHDNLVQILTYLDTVLPNGSHIILTGLANGSVLYDSLSEQIHPLGRARSDVKYKDFYTWLSCLHISPCNGWMTTNSTLRQLTTNYAMMLSDIVKNVSSSYRFKNFDTFYTIYPIATVFDKWIAMGGQPWQLLEPVDGFHMNQIANGFAGDIFWDILSEQKPNWLGPVNPYNNLISKLFGDQGGY